MAIKREITTFIWMYVWKSREAPEPRAVQHQKGKAFLDARIANKNGCKALSIFHFHFEQWHINELLQRENERNKTKNTHGLKEEH